MNCDVSLEVFIAGTVTNHCSLYLYKKLCAVGDECWENVTVLRWEMRRTASALKNVNFSVNVPRDVGRVRNHKPKKKSLGLICCGN